MSFFGLVFTGVGLAMDAAAVCLSKGITFKNKFNIGDTLRLSVTFAIFQGVMIVIGSFIGGYFSGIIDKYNKIIVVLVFMILGIKMLVEALKDDEQEDEKELKSIDFKELMSLGFATSLDALAVGVTFASMPKQKIVAPIIIAVTTFLVSIFGALIGYGMGKKIKGKYAEIIGAVILILIGIAEIF